MFRVVAYTPIGKLSPDPKYSVMLTSMADRRCFPSVHWILNELIVSRNSVKTTRAKGITVFNDVIVQLVFLFFEQLLQTSDNAWYSQWIWRNWWTLQSGRTPSRDLFAIENRYEVRRYADAMITSPCSCLLSVRWQLLNQQSRQSFLRALSGLKACRCPVQLWTEIKTASAAVSGHLKFASLNAVLRETQRPVNSSSWPLCESCEHSTGRCFSRGHRMTHCGFKTTAETFPCCIELINVTIERFNWTLKL